MKKIKLILIIIMTSALCEMVAASYVFKREIQTVVKTEESIALSDIKDIHRANHIHWLLSNDSDLVPDSKLNILKKIISSHSAGVIQSEELNLIKQSLESNQLPEKAIMTNWLIELQHRNFILEKQKEHNSSKRNSVATIFGNQKLILSTIVFLISIIQLALAIGWLSGMSINKNG